MKKLSVLLAIAPLLMASACASRPFRPTAYPTVAEPDTARAYGDFMVARVAALTNDPETASRYYAASIGTAPEDMDVAERAVYSALMAGDFGLAAGVARRADAGATEAGLVPLTLAADALVHGQAQGAIDILKAQQLTFFHQMIALNLEAWSQLERGNLAEAVALAGSNRTGDRRLDNATNHIVGLLQVAAEDDAAAAETFAALWAAGARLAVGAEAYAELLAARGDRDEALDILTTFRTEVSYNASLEALRLRIERGDKIEPKRLTLREGAALSFQLPAAVLLQNTSNSLATPYLVIALALDADLHQARVLWVQALLLGERPQEAIRVLREIPDASPFYAAARGQLANLLHIEGRDEDALRVAAEALAARPDRGLKLQIAGLYRALKREADAEAILSEVMVADAAVGQDDWRVHFLRGAARERQVKWEGAEADLKRALELDPDNATVLNYLGYSWIDRGINLKEGLALIQQAVALEPGSGQIVDSLGWAHYRLGEYEQAVEFLERAVTLLPADAVLNDHLGDAYWKAGRRNEAGFQWKRALKLDPPAEDQARIQQKLLGGFDREPAPGAAVAR